MIAPEGQSSNAYEVPIQPKTIPPFPSHWVSEVLTIPASDGDEIYAVFHREKEWKHKSVLFCVHGFGEHGGRYYKFPHYVQGSIGGVFIVDQRGHGRRKGQRGHSPDFELLVEDLALCIKRLDSLMLSAVGVSDLHMVGHSMGGLLCIRTLMRYPDLPIRSVTVAAPALKLFKPVSQTLKSVVRLLVRVAPTLKFKSELTPELMTHDKDEVETYMKDPLNHNNISAKFFLGFEDAMAGTSAQSRIAYNLQVLVPMQDGIIDPKHTVEWCKNVEAKSLSLKTYPDFFHECFNEVGQQTAFEDLLAWVHQHSSIAGGPTTTGTSLQQSSL